MISPSKVLQEDIVVAAGLHLGKLQLLPLRAQVADVDQLRVTLVVAAGQDVRQGAGRVQRRQAGDSQLDAAVVQVDEIPDIARFRGAGEDHIVDLGRPPASGTPGCPGPACPPPPHRCPGWAISLGGAFRGVELVAHLVQLPGDIHDLRLIPVVHGDQHAAAALLLHLVAGGDQALEQGLLHVLAQAQHLAGGLHLRGEGRIGVGDLLKGEHRHLHRHIRRLSDRARCRSPGQPEAVPP